MELVKIFEQMTHLFFKYVSANRRIHQNVGRLALSKMQYFTNF
ncbi:MAG: hypothetical protein IGBAC_0146 [Ignavibacteriae bacterium]|nr:MAG: hypothetical protein IGBAC_0146 [Ignavibacteriota bacterium]